MVYCTQQFATQLMCENHLTNFIYKVNIWMVEKEEEKYSKRDKNMPHYFDFILCSMNFLTIWPN